MKCIVHVHGIKSQSLFRILAPNIECLMHLHNATTIGCKYYKYFGFRMFETGEYLRSRPNSSKVRYAPEIVRKGGVPSAHTVQCPVSKVKDLKHKIVFG